MPYPPCYDAPLRFITDTNFWSGVIFQLKFKTDFIMSYALEFKPNLIDFTEQDIFLIYNISIPHKIRHLFYQNFTQTQQTFHKLKNY